MPLAPGTRLGPCEIVAPLGAGGLSEVHYPITRGLVDRQLELGREADARAALGRYLAPEAASEHDRAQTRGRLESLDRSP